MYFFQILQYQYFKLSDSEMKHVLVPQLDPKMEHAIQRKYKSISIRYSKITFAKQITGLNVPQKEVLQVVLVLQDLEFAVFVSFENQKKFLRETEFNVFSSCCWLWRFIFRESNLF